MFDDFSFEPDDIGQNLAEVDPLEIQRVVAALDDLIRTVENETVKVYLHAACEDVNNLLSAGDEDGWAEAA
jgi:hypothetical protein